jgi:hypothetical protein
MQEADTTTEWDVTTVAKFLSIVPPLAVSATGAAQVVTTIPATGVLPTTPVGMSLNPPDSSAYSGAAGIGAEIELLRATLNAGELAQVKDIGRRDTAFLGT